MLLSSLFNLMSKQCLPLPSCESRWIIIPRRHHRFPDIPPAFFEQLFWNSAHHQGLGTLQNLHFSYLFSPFNVFWKCNTRKRLCFLCTHISLLFIHDVTAYESAKMWVFRLKKKSRLALLESPIFLFHICIYYDPNILCYVPHILLFPGYNNNPRQQSLH